MNALHSADSVVAATTTAIEQCEMILAHLRGDDRDGLNANFLRVHALSLLQLVGEMSHPANEPFRPEEDELSVLFGPSC